MPIRHTPFRAPIDLSDLEGFARIPGRPRCVVFIGRVSTRDNQNPATSIPRQVASASAFLMEGEEFAAYYWDVESGMLPPSLRGLGPQEMYDALEVPTPRDGGLQDLVERAEQLGVTHAVAERSDRLARAMLTSLTVEHELEQRDIEVVYANEPVGGTKSGQLSSRRHSQVDAEIYRTKMMEMSMGGQEQHAVGGWNHGHPPYPYIAVVDENAPAQRDGRFGPPRPKKKLVAHPDPRRFDTAAELCRLRREEYLSGGDIARILSADPDRYPIDGEWTWGRVEGLIANPKLTGYQVYNRKASRTARPGSPVANPISEWVWSPRTAHQAVITVEEWKRAQEVTAGLRGGAEEFIAQERLRAAAARRGLTVSVLHSSGAHTQYQIGDRRVVLPSPVPEQLIGQVIRDVVSA